jgi:hypothetical protein
MEDFLNTRNAAYFVYWGVLIGTKHNTQYLMNTVKSPTPMAYHHGCTKHEVCLGIESNVAIIT